MTKHDSNIIKKKKKHKTTTFFSGGIGAVSSKWNKNIVPQGPQYEFAHNRLQYGLRMLTKNKNLTFLPKMC